jgi:hypothetical protein
MAILAITKNTIKGTGYDILSNGISLGVSLSSSNQSQLHNLPLCLLLLAIWPEIADSLKNLTAIFNPGHPEVFHRVLPSFFFLSSLLFSSLLSFRAGF